MADIKRPPIIWASPALASALPLTKPFEAVYEWDNEARKFSDTQQVIDGQRVWQAEALLPQGWGRDTAPLAVRMLSVVQPTIKPDPAKVVEALGMTQPQAHRGGE